MVVVCGLDAQPSAVLLSALIIVPTQDLTVSLMNLDENRNLRLRQSRKARASLLTGMCYAAQTARRRCKFA